MGEVPSKGPHNLNCEELVEAHVDNCTVAELAEYQHAINTAITYQRRLDQHLEPAPEDSVITKQLVSKLEEVRILLWKNKNAQEQ